MTFCRASRAPTTSGDTTPCRMTGVTLHGILSPDYHAEIRLVHGLEVLDVRVTLCRTNLHALRNPSTFLGTERASFLAAGP